MGSLLINFVIMIGIFGGALLIIRALRLPQTFKLVTIGLVGLILILLVVGLVSGVGPVRFGGIN